MARQKLVDGALVDLTAAEETACDAEEAAANVESSRDRLRDEFITEGVARVSAQVPEWDTLDKIEMVRSLWPGLSPPAAWALPRDLYLYARASVAKVATLDAAELLLIIPGDAKPFAGVDGADTGWPV